MEKRSAYHAVFAGGSAEITEKKSRFIGELREAKSEEAALSFVEEVRKAHYDARHHCFAYIIGTDGKLLRAADDGEPQGTAGRPILDAMQGADLRFAALVVTRYFGGTLLGTGGLSRAYAAAAQAAIEAAVIIEKRPGWSGSIRADYTDVGKLTHLLSELSIPVLDTEYTDVVCFHIVIPDERQGFLEARLADATAGKAGLAVGDPVYFAEHAGSYIL